MADPADGAPVPASAAAVDLHTLLGQFVALRHEVNLQTRASRAQQEHNAETLTRLSEALQALEKNRDARREETEQQRTEILRPLLKTLVDMHDALALAQREVRRVQENLLPELDQEAETFSALVPAVGFFGRWLGLEKTAANLQAGQRAGQQRAQQVVERSRRLVNSLSDGYTMSLRRLERTLEQAGLEPIPAVGEAFDPETMEVVEVVHEADREDTEVLDEVRRGYLWQGRVFRFAQVRVARPAMGPS